VRLRSQASASTPVTGLSRPVVRAILPSAILLLLLTGCSSLFGPSKEEQAAAVSEAVQSSSSEISAVEVIPAIDGFSRYFHLYVTMNGDDVTAAQIDGFLAAATPATPEDRDRITFGVYPADGDDSLSILEQARELGVPAKYVLDDYTLELPLEWLRQEHDTAR